MVDAVDVAVRQRPPEKERGSLTQQLLHPDVFLTKAVVAVVQDPTHNVQMKYRCIIAWLFSLGCPYPSEQTRKASS